MKVADSPADEAGDRVVQTLEHRAGADHVGQILGGGVLEFLAVLAGAEVDGQVITVLDRTLDLIQRAEPLAQGVELLIDQ